MIISFWGME